MPQSHLQGGKVLQQLLDGNFRWVNAQPIRNLRKATRKAEELVQFQDPHAVIVTCSDSRVIPEFMFDANVGDLFVIRVAGNVINPEILASIEFACVNLHASIVLVLGHQNCGAIAAKQRVDNELMVSDNMSRLLKKIEVKKDQSSLEATAYNAEVQCKRISNESSIISDLVLQDKVLIKSAVYNMSSRLVELN
ncbi:MAG: carbonic anhydrase [Candidatus Kariarchaeaceae archaeon]|jgi:carbonic anhydrase